MTALLDTSMIVRYLTGDPPAMADASAEVIESAAELRVSSVVLAESAFVLRSFYEVPRDRVVDELIELLTRRNIETLELNTDLACEALTLCRPSGRVSFADALLWAAARAEEIPVHTMDQRFPEDGIAVLRH